MSVDAEYDDTSFHLIRALQQKRLELHGAKWLLIHVISVG